MSGSGRREPLTTFDRIVEQEIREANEPKPPKPLADSFVPAPMLPRQAVPPSRAGTTRRRIVLSGEGFPWASMVLAMLSTLVFFLAILFLSGTAAICGTILLATSILLAAVQSAAHWSREAAVAIQQADEQREH